MIISCPHCGASFRVDPAKIGTAGRTVRCGGCGHSWHQAPQAAASEPVELDFEVEETPGEAPVPVAGPPPEDIEAKISETRKRSQARGAAAAKRREAAKRSLPVGWIALVLLLAGLGAGILLGHQRLVALAPASAPVFEALGLQQPVGAGLELRDITFKREEIDGRVALVIDGAIVNVSGADLAVPSLQASLLDPEGEALTSWVFKAGVEALPQNGFTQFQTIAAEPPPADKVSIVFVQAVQP